MPCLLILDASSSFCSVTLVAGKQQWHASEQQPRRQAQRLLPMVDELLQQAGVAKSALQGIAYGRGPGSFTGIRIAASVLQGIALALDLPVYGTSSLQAVAQAAFQRSTANQIAVILNAHMDEVFWGTYQRTSSSEPCLLVGSEQVGSIEQCLQTLQDFTGDYAGNGLQLDGLRHLPQQFANIEPQSEFMLEQVMAAWQQQQFSEFEQHQPVYLRDSVAWKKLSEQPSLLKNTTN